MKILITSDCYLPTVNGVVTSIQQLSENLKLQGHDVRILTLSQSLRSYVEGDVTYLASMDADLIYPDARIRLPVLNEKIADLLEWGPEVIHTQSEFSSYLVARRMMHRLDVPIVHTYHTAYEDYTHYFSPSERLGKAIVASASRAFCRKLQAVIAPTEKVRKMLEGYGIGPDGCKVYVVPTGIDSAPFSDCSGREAFRAKYGITSDECLLVAVGRLGKEKNYEEILEYLAEYNNKDLRLLIVGDGPNRANLEELSKELGLEEQVVFAGMIPHSEIGICYSSADLFVCASSSETQGLTYLEAQAASLPILCRRDECLSEVILNGHNGWQYETYEEFAEYLTKLLEPELRIAMGSAAKAHMEKYYSAAAFARKIAEIYGEVIASYTPDSENDPE